MTGRPERRRVLAGGVRRWGLCVRKRRLVRLTQRKSLASPAVGLYSVEVSVGSNVFGYCVVVNSNGAGSTCF